MRAIIISLLLFIPVTVWGQNAFEVSLSITDSVIYVKEGIKNNSYSVKVDVEINVSNLHDTLFLYRFYKYVSAGFFNDEEPFDDFYKNTYPTIGLNYILENKYHHIIERKFILTSYASRKAEKRAMRTRAFVTSNLKIKRRVLNDIELSDYDFAKYEITNEKQISVLYPLFGRLRKGEYYLYFVYVFVPNPHPLFYQNINDSRTFKGTFVSNKVKLIVK